MIVIAGNSKIGIKIQNVGINKESAKRSIQSQLNEIGRSLQITIGGQGNERLINSFRELTTSVRDSRTQINNLNNSLDQINTSHQQFGNTSERVQRNYLTNMSNIINKVKDWLIGTSLVIGAIRQFQDGVKYIVNMNQAITDLSKVTDFTNEQLKEMANSAIEIGNTFAKSSVDIMNAMAEFGRISKTEEDIKKLTEAATVFSNVTTLTAEQASKTISTGLTAFGLQTKDAMDIVDKFNNIQNKYKTNAEDLAAAVENVGGVAQTAGLSIDQLNSIITAMTVSTGKSGSELSNSVKTIIARTYSIGEEGEEAAGKVEEALGRIGIATRNTEGEFRDFDDILVDLSKQWNDLSNVTQLNIAQIMSGKLHYSKFIALMDKFNIKQQAYIDSSASYGSAMQENEKQVNSLNGKIQLLKNAFEEFWNTSINSSFIASVLDLSKSFISLANSVGGLIPILSALIAGFVSFKIMTYINNIKVLNQTLLQTASQMVIASGNTMTMQQALQTLGVASNSAKIGLLGINAVFGLISVGISGAILAFSYFANKQNEAQQKSEQLTNELKEQKDALDQNSSEYIKIINSTDSDIKKKEQLIALQKQLVNSFGDEAKKIDLVNGKYQEQINKLNELSLKKSEETIKKFSGESESAQKSLEKINTTLLAISNSSSIYGGEAGNFFGLNASLFSKTIKTLQNDFDDLRKSGEKVAKIDIVGGNGKESIKLSGTLEEQKNTIGLLIQSFDKKKNKTNDEIKILSNLNQYYSELDESINKYQKSVNKVASARDVIEYTKAFGTEVLKAKGYIEKYNNATEKLEKSKYEKKINNIKNALEEQAQSGNYSKGVISLLDSEFDTYIKTSDKAKKATKSLSESNELANLSGEKLERTEKEINKTFNNSIKVIDSISKALGEYDATGKISANTIEGLIDDYPELLGHLSSEEDLRNALIQVQKNETQSAINSLKEKLLASSDFFTTYKKNNSDFFKTLSETYKLDVKSWANMAQAKQKIENELIKVLGNNWKMYYDTTGAYWEEASKKVSQGEITGSEYAGQMSEMARLSQSTVGKTVKQYQELYDSLGNIDKVVNNLATTDFDKFLNKNIAEDTQNAIDKIDKSTKSNADSISKATDKLTASTIEMVSGDKYYEVKNALSQINAQLQKNANLQDLIAKKQNATIDEQIKLLNEQINLTKDKQNLDHQYAEAKRTEMQELKTKLSSQGVEFTGTGDSTIISNLQKIKDQKLNELNSVAKTINETITKTVEVANNVISGLPVEGASVTSGFGKRTSPTAGASSNHQGIDLSATLNQAVKTMFGGSVTYAGWMQGYGNTVKVKTAEGLEELFGHLNNIAVSVGQQISSGTKIGGAGSTGISTGTHLHYGVMENGQWIDPTTVLNKSATTTKQVTEQIVKDNTEAYNKAKENYDAFTTDVDTFTQIQSEEIPNLSADWLSLESSIEDIKKQITELLVTKLENTFTLFDKSLETSTNEADKLNRTLSNLDETKYEDKLKITSKLLDNSKEKTKKYSDEIENLLHYNTQTSEESERLAERIQELTKAMEDSKQTALDYAKSLKQIKQEEQNYIDNIISGYANSIISQIQDDIENDQKHITILTEFYEKKIKVLDDAYSKSTEKLKNKYDGLTKELEKSYNTLVEKTENSYDSLMETMENNHKSEIESLEDEIKTLDEKNNALETEKELKEILEDIDKKRIELTNIEKEKNKRVLINGKWTYVSDTEAIEKTTEELNKLTENYNKKISDIELETQKKILQNKIDTKNDEYDVEKKSEENKNKLLKKSQEEEYNTNKKNLENELKDKEEYYKNSYNILKTNLENERDTKIQHYKIEIASLDWSLKYQLSEYTNTNQNIYDNLYAVYNDLRGLDTSLYEDRLDYLKDFVSNYNKEYNKLKTSSSTSSTTSTSTISSTAGTAKTAPTTSLSETDTTSSLNKKVLVNQGVAGKQVYETIASVEARQKVRYDAAIASGNKSLANQIRTETVKAIGQNVSSFDTEGYVGNWSNQSGKLAMVHPDEWILSSKTVSGIIQGNIYDNLASKFKNITPTSNNSTETNYEINIDNLSLPNVSNGNDFLSSLRMISRKGKS